MEKCSDDSSSIGSSELALSQISQKSQLSQLEKEFEGKKVAINEPFNLSHNKGIFDNIYYKRKEAVEYLHNIFGTDKTLKQYSKNGSYINLKCSNSKCCFRIVCRRLKSRKENPFIIDTEKSKFIHGIVDISTGKTTGLCSSMKRVTTVYMIYYFYIANIIIYL